MRKYVSWKTALLARSCGFFLLDECDSGFNPNDGTVIEEAWAWLRRFTPDQCYPRPEQWLLQEWLRIGFGIQVDIFYETGGYSGRVFRLGDPEQRWQSCTTREYVDTLENMLVMGLAMTDIKVEHHDRAKVWAAGMKEALEHHD